MIYPTMGTISTNHFCNPYGSISFGFGALTKHLFEKMEMAELQCLIFALDPAIGEQIRDQVDLTEHIPQFEGLMRGTISVWIKTGTNQAMTIFSASV